MKTAGRTFQEHVSGVRSLMNFDRDVQDMTISHLAELAKTLAATGRDHAYRTVERTRAILQGIRSNDSLRPRYATIFNQALVLLVSYFGSTVADIFRSGVRRELDRDVESKLFGEELRVIIGELRDQKFEIRDAIPELLISSKKISFQDMQSVHRAFRDHLELEVEKTPLVHDIIAGQACRHAIVHTGGVVNDRILRQVANARPRRVKPALKRDEVVEFSPEEVELVADAMSLYVGSLSAKVAERVGALI
jgi:hypothetical protein